ncbi:GSU2403 family nucleotidyltransferase fold protein [Phenylobacterium sp.]|uniref:GSU2403 family nucleotidyltransferase fold protein n=1 Tax=Phenylobacterium sp. TaxID=1871053 RepID=UPI0025F3E7CE|nr:GSU2403 family nucleotidyltransferase fold protein [Phenylobacterium sp.]MBX3484813.1 hypothetical protein [Phenylobacterium sp.]MCW5760391.1 hypothetical protein [Phenylobacterium sp.]
MILAFTDEQNRTLINLEQQYQVWMEAERALAAMPYDLRRKKVGAKSYLYEIRDRGGNGRSLGPWSDAQASRLASYRAAKDAAKARRAAARDALAETARICRALRVPMLANEAGEIVREADRRRLLGDHLLVVGTNALAAYAIEAGGFLQDAPLETQDFDLAWSSREAPADQQLVWDMLKAVDPTYTVNLERTFQARNAKAYEVGLLVAPSRAATLPRRDKPRPIPLPEQEWLLNGKPVDHVTICRDGSPARIVAPDPRWFALQKLWMSRQPKRNPLKRRKDERQGVAILNAVASAMPQYRLDPDFEAELPAELTGVYADWSTQRPEPAPKRW